MPISSFGGLNTALRGLLAEQRALDVTAHNIANADRAGYTRQEAVLASAHALDVAAGALQNGAGALLGQGVDVVEYRRIRDGFLDLQYRAQNMALGQHETTAGKLAQVESVLQEPGDNGIGALLDKFWSAWGDLANHPESAAAKAAVAGHATTLAGAIRALDANLAAIGTAAASEYAGLTSATGTVAQIGAELGRLDGAISQNVAAGRQPNDLLDRRDELLDQLSKLGRVQVTELGGGSISVQFGDAAAPLTNGQTVTWPQALTAPGGKLGALTALSGSTIPALRADLDAIAAGLTGAVNAIHPTAVFAGTTAATFTVVATPASIDASSATTAGANDAAIALAALRNATPTTGYADLVRRIGALSADAATQARTAGAVTASLGEQRASVAGVSMDEEMANMVRFQRGYQASARAMTTMDELFDTLINRTGRVGL